MLADGLAERTEDDPVTGQLFFESRRYRDAVEYRVHGDARQAFLLLDGNAEPAERLKYFRIDFVQTVQRRPLFGRRIIRDGLEINLV